MAWSGQPMLMDEFLFKTKHGLVDQSLHSRMGAETTNGDGFGVGWYGAGDGPAYYHSISPAWGDENLRELAAHVETRLFLAHVRATSGTAVQQTNCHPFRHGRWLFVHNGVLRGFHLMRRDLMLAVDPALYPLIEGTTDSEVLFFLAVTLGLEDDPPGAVARAIGLVEDVGRRHGVEYPFQGTIATTDGERLWAFRYASDGKARSLYFSTSYETLKMLYPDDPRLDDFDEETRVVVSEPLGDLVGVWNPVPEASWGVVQPGPDELSTFRPAPPVAA